jgi:hypothetical protein
VKKFDGERALNLYKEFLGEERAKRLPGICLEYPFDKMKQDLATTKFHNDTVVLWVLGNK